MIKNTENKDQQTKIIENLARNLASKRPKETNFNNTKTRKYFGNKHSKDMDLNSNTLVDSLLANQVCSSISTNNKTDSISSLINKKITEEHKRIPSNIFRVSKNLGQFTEILSSQKTFIKIPAKFVDEESCLNDSLEELNENIKCDFLNKQNKTFEKYNFNKTLQKESNPNLNNNNFEFLQINSNYADGKNNKESKKLNLTDINLGKNLKNSNLMIKNSNTNYEYEKEKVEFFDIFNYENLFNMHKYYSKLINNFEMNNNFFLREKILNKLFEIINSKPYYFPHRSVKYFDDRALNKNIKIYFFLEITILALLYHSNINDLSDLYCAFKHCLFYLNQNLLILTHFIVEKLEHIEKHLKKDTNFENYYFNTKINPFKEILVEENDNQSFKEINLVNIFEKNLLDKEYVKMCINKLDENKTWLDKNYIFKNFNNNNKNLVNVLKNIIDIFINMPNNNNDILVVYYEIKDILLDFGKVKLDKTLENLNEKLIKKLCESNELNKEQIISKEKIDLKRVNVSSEDILGINSKNKKNVNNEDLSDSEDNKKNEFNNSINNRNNSSKYNTLDNPKEKVFDNKIKGDGDHSTPTDSPRPSLTNSHESSVVKHQIKSFPDFPTKLKLNNEPPYLPSKSLMRNPRSYTLVLDLDETLVHFVEENDSAYIQIRPGAEHFLEEMSKFYEIVVFTAAMQDYADLVLNELDKQKSVSFRLYRQHTVMQNNFYIKDIEKLGRELEKMIIIDNVAENYKLQKENGINIKNFEGDEEDTELLDLIHDLRELVINKVDDIRKYLPDIITRMDNRNKERLETADNDNNN